MYHVGSYKLVVFLYITTFVLFVINLKRHNIELYDCNNNLQISLKMFDSDRYSQCKQSCKNLWLFLNSVCNICSRVPLHRGTTIHPTNSPNVNEWGLPTTPLVTQEEFWALEAAMIEIGRLATVGTLNACETFRHSFSCRLVDDGKVCDGCFGPTGLGFR